MRRTFTTKNIEHFQPQISRRTEFRDALLPGFGLRITPQGRKSWFVVGRHEGRQVRHTIGTYPVLSLSEAREAARGVIAQLQLGTYIDRRTPIPEQLTFASVKTAFIEKHAKPNNRDWQSTERLLCKFASFDHKPLAEVRRADVIAVLDAMVAAGTPIRANRALAAVKKLFAWSLDRGLIDLHPVVGLKPVGKETRRERLLSDYEIMTLWVSCETEGFPFGTLTQLLLLTGQRRGEVTSMRWSNVDLQSGVWTIPGHVAKNGRAHDVPLSTTASKVLQCTPRFDGSDLVFTTNGISPVSGFGRAKNRLDYALGAADWRFHDLRRTAASGMAKLAVAPHVIEKVLNHVSGQISGVAAVYNRYGYDHEKQEALQKWATHLSSLQV